MTTAEVADTEIPKGLLKRLIKARLAELEGADPTRDYQINKDALLAFQEAAKLFIHYLTATANDVCRDARRQTISAEDVLAALNDLEFGELTAGLTEALEDFRADAKEKTKKKAEGRKRKAEEAEAGAGDGPEALSGAHPPSLGEEAAGDPEAGSSPAPTPPAEAPAPPTAAEAEVQAAVPENVGALAPAAMDIV